MINLGNGQIALGDCLDVMRSIPAGSVDMVLCDLPYGTTACSWDSVIPLEPLWSEYWRIAKPNAAVVLTAAQPFTSALVMSQASKFRYEWIWSKNKPSGFLNAKKQPLRQHESILVFSKIITLYNPQMTVALNPDTRKTINSSDNKPGGTYHGSKRFGNNRSADTGLRYPLSIQQFDKVGVNIHPTQKPVALFEYLIRTYTNEGDTVMDNCLGSGTTAIAAENTGRRWIGIERDVEYFGKACERIARHLFP